MSEILGNICDRSIAIVLEIVETYFLRKMFQNLMFMFYFYPKSSRTGSRKLPDPSLSKVFNLPSIGFRYILSFEWPDFGLKYLVTSQAPKLKSQPPKFKASVRNFPISETGSKCNLACWWWFSYYYGTKKKDRVQLCMYFLSSWYFKGYRNLPFIRGEVRYNKLSIATSMNLCIQYAFIWFVVDA